MKNIFILGAVYSLWLISISNCGAVPPTVVASIPPIHSLAAGVMEGVGSPALLIRKGESPHSFSLRPSGARILQDAKIVFWVGEGLENFLKRPLATLSQPERIVTLSKVSGLILYPVRTEGAWWDGQILERHGGHISHNGPKKPDMHLWLDPRNARILVRAMAVELSRVNSGSQAHYMANAKRLIQRLNALEVEIRTTLEPVQQIPYVVFHDAYRYFEERFGLRPMGSIVIGSGRMPGARRLTALRRKIHALGAVCIFAEPQFKPPLLKTISEGTSARVGVLDPLGANIEPGPELYFSLLKGLGAALRTCLAPVVSR